jgi:hypothetical protein
MAISGKYRFRSGSTDSWRSELSKWEIALVDHLAGPLMAEQGYTRTKDSKTWSALASMGWTSWEIMTATKRIFNGSLECRHAPLRKHASVST